MLWNVDQPLYILNTSRRSARPRPTLFEFPQTKMFKSVSIWNSTWLCIAFHFTRNRYPSVQQQCIAVVACASMYTFSTYVESKINSQIFLLMNSIKFLIIYEICVKSPAGTRRLLSAGNRRVSGGIGNPPGTRTGPGKCSHTGTLRGSRTVWDQDKLSHVGPVCIPCTKTGGRPPGIVLA